MPEPTLCTWCGKRPTSDPHWCTPAPDDPGVYARSCLRCGLDEGMGENRLCATCCPPAPWWASILRTVDERALLLRLWRRVRRFMARCAGEGM